MLQLKKKRKEKAFSIIDAVISNDNDEILRACTTKISSMKVNVGEAKATLTSACIKISDFPWQLFSHFGRGLILLQINRLF
jgi:hypothetical protein